MANQLAALQQRVREIEARVGELEKTLKSDAKDQVTTTLPKKTEVTSKVKTESSK